MRRIALSFALCAALAAGASRAHAQMPTVDPGGQPPPAEPAPVEPQPADPVIVQVPVQADGTPIEPVDESAFYYYDDEGTGGRRYFGDQRGNNLFGAVPPSHVVRRGDTLWDICWFYFNNPWEWPKIWSYNASITNPHWIYPGDLVRLYPAGLSVGGGDLDGDPGGDPDGGDVEQPLPAQRYGVQLRQVAFVDRDELEFEATIVGSVEEKTLLSLGDAVYLDYKGKPPKVGKRYAIYTERTPVTHPDGDRRVGAYVRLLGELQITSVKKGKRARAFITSSIDVIERGSRVGPLQRTFRTVEPRANEVDLRGTVVAMIGTDQLIGEGQLIFIDKGESDGVKVGNRMFVVRRGDAREELVDPSYNVGQDDARFPNRSVGRIIVVQAGKNASVALVTLSLRAIGVGDRVLMRKEI